MKTWSRQRAGCTAEFWWPLQNGCTDHNPLRMALIGWCVCVCEWLSFNCPTFCQKHSVASKVVIDGYISVPSHINWWSSMFRSHKEPNIWQIIHGVNFQESLFLQGIINKDFSASKQVLTSAESCPAMQRSSAQGPNCLVRHLLGGQDGGMKY